MFIEAELGTLQKDSADIWHYVTRPDTDVEAAAAEAINLRNQRKGRQDSVMFFWHMNTYVAIRNIDSPHMLVAHHRSSHDNFATGNTLTILRMVSRDAGLKLPLEVRIAQA